MSPGAGHRAVVLAQGLVQLHAAPLPLGEVCLSNVAHRAHLGPAHLRGHTRTHRTQTQPRVTVLLTCVTGPVWAEGGL